MTDPKNWASEQHYHDVQTIAFDLDEAMGKILHGATVRYERFNFGHWVAYLRTAEEPNHEYIGSAGSAEGALFQAVALWEREQKKKVPVVPV